MDRLNWMDEFLPIVIGILLVFLFFPAFCHAEPIHKEVYAIIGEFENETSYLAGACTIRNRETAGIGLKGVYGLRSKRVTERLYSTKTLVKAIKSWEDSRSQENCQIVSGANHWQSISDMKVSRSWRDKCEMTYFSGKTYFFKCGS